VASPGVIIGSEVIVGAGSVVVRNTPDGKVAYGSPSRIVRENAIVRAVGLHAGTPAK
jgi:maltose O-acetyltransferase